MDRETLKKGIKIGKEIEVYQKELDNLKVVDLIIFKGGSRDILALQVPKTADEAHNERVPGKPKLLAMQFKIELIKWYQGRIAILEEKLKSL